MSEAVAQTAQMPRLISLKAFTVDMMGYRSVISYYDHLGDPGWPQRVYLGKKPMLRYDQCLAYYNRMVEGHANDNAPQTTTPPPRKRRVGRPVKLPRSRSV